MTDIDEIAKLAKVSRSTVSRVINDEPRISDETRNRVLQIIREQDFHPNTAARTLAGRRSYIVGLVIQRPLNTIYDPFFAGLIQVITIACEEHGYQLMMSLASTNKPEAYSKIVRGGHQDGLIIFYSCTDDVLAKRLAREHIPFVLIGRPLPGADFFSVDVDNVRGAECVAEHLASLGYTRIATIAGPAHAICSVDRLAGFLKGLRAHGLCCPRSYIQEADFSEISAYHAMERLLAKDPRPQAVFVANDTMAVSAIRAVRAANLRVPEDVAIVGFDDMSIAAMGEPPLTTVRQSPELLGRNAVKLLMNQIIPDSSGTEQQHNIVLPVELIVRKSCGALLRQTEPGSNGAHTREVI
jgi:LacI family transcriptional regulator